MRPSWNLRPALQGSRGQTGVQDQFLYAHMWGPVEVTHPTKASSNLPPSSSTLPLDPFLGPTGQDDLAGAAANV